MEVDGVREGLGPVGWIGKSDAIGLSNKAPQQQYIIKV